LKDGLQLVAEHHEVVILRVRDFKLLLERHTGQHVFKVHVLWHDLFIQGVFERPQRTNKLPIGDQIILTLFGSHGHFCLPLRLPGRFIPGQLLALLLGFLLNLDPFLFLLFHVLEP